MEQENIDSNTKELKIEIGYLTSGENTIVVDNDVAKLTVPANVVDLTDIEGADYIKISQNIVVEDDRKTLIEKLPNDLKTVGKIIDLKLQVFDSKDNLIKNIHKFSNNQKVRIGIKLTSEQIKNLDTDKLAMYYYDENKKNWVELGGSFDKTTMEFSYNTSHFTKFAVMEKAVLQEAVLQEAESEIVAKLPNTGSVIPTNALALLSGVIMLVSGALMRKKSK